jgi:dTDP-4-dehydrorhamnose reductase
MKILITGANGMLGEKCVRLLAKQYSILATDLADNLIYDCVVSYRKMDITDPYEVKAIVSDFMPETIINCAAYTSVDGAETSRELAWQVNATGPINLLAAIRPSNVPIIHISTDYIFDGVSGPYKENDPIKPINYYGQTKLAGERAILAADVPITVFRTNVLFGESTNQEASFVSWVVRKLSRRETINVVNDQFGNPTWVDGLAEVIEIAIDREIRGLFHYGGADYVNRLEFALLIAAVFGLDPTLIRPISTRSLGQKAPRPYRAGLVCDKIINEFGIRLYSIKEALEAMKGMKT